MTKQRKLIKEIIYASCIHPTAEEIFVEAKRIMPSIAFGTVYRNLSLLVESGEVRKIEVPDGPSRYDKTLKPHEHLICEGCQRVTDVKMDGLFEVLNEKTGYKITGYKLTMYYLCPKCRKNKKN